MNDFKTEFLERYLQNGLGSMAKSDVDALVMYLLDKYGRDQAGPLAPLSNQVVSERLRTPVTKIRTLRYNATLKYGGRVEDEATARLLAALSRASLELDGAKIHLILEDQIARNWLQGQLKSHQLIYDHSFNSEVLKVSTEGLFSVLRSLFDNALIGEFEQQVREAQALDDDRKRLSAFKSVALEFAVGAAQGMGGEVLQIFTSLISD